MCIINLNDVALLLSFIRYFSFSFSCIFLYGVFYFIFRCANEIPIQFSLITWSFKRSRAVTTGTTITYKQNKRNQKCALHLYLIVLCVFEYVVRNSLKSAVMSHITALCRWIKDENKSSLMLKLSSPGPCQSLCLFYSLFKWYTNFY